MLLKKPINELTGNANLAWQGREVLGGKPTRVFDLGVTQENVTPRVSRSESNH